MGFSNKVAGNAQGAAKPAGNAGFLMHGEESAQAIQHEEAKAEAAKAAAGKLWRFWIDADKLGEDFKITFLDGGIDKNTKMFKNPTWYEHGLKLGNSFDTFICTQKVEPCPICAGGDKPSLVMGFTIIDHRSVEIKKGDNAGKILPFTRKLYVAKRKTVGLLQKIVLKCDPDITGIGLRGVEMDVSRSTATSPNVGDVLFPQGQHEESDLLQMFGEKDSQPANWAEELVFRSAEELVALGVAAPIKTLGAEKPSKEYTGHL